MKNIKTVSWIGAAVLLVSLWLVPSVRSQIVSGAAWVFDTVTGSLLVSLGTLISCEDEDNNSCNVQGANVRGTEGNIINSAVGDATSSAFQLPTGPKSFTARITGAGAVVQTIKIYGGTSSGMAAATSTELCTISLSGTSGAAGTADMCPVITAPILYYKVVTSASSGTPTTILTANY